MKKFIIKQILFFFVVYLIYLVAFYGMYHFRVMEAILSPSPNNGAGLKFRFSIFFLLFKFFIIFLAPGIFLSELFLKFTKEEIQDKQ